MEQSSSDTAAAGPFPTPRGAAWGWEDDELTCDLVRELRDGTTHETRAFLRPIFKWMKGGVRKNGQKNDELVERAFAFVDWMVQLAHEGDAEREIPMLPKLQPSYALNTIVTSSQRAGSLPEAKRAFELLTCYGFEPDVFTYTALIDVTARSGDVQAAIEIYEAMRATRSRPNIVTFTTVIRALGSSTHMPAIECLRFLGHAREEETFDEALYIEALETCASRQAMIAASAVLRDLTQHDVTLRNSERLVRAIATLVDKRADKATLLSDWLHDGIVTQHEIDQIGITTSTKSRTEGPKSLGALGNQTSDSVRLAVVQHDIARLTERIANDSMVSTNDFETLIHQCRKRKWKEEVDMIIQAMRKLATEGWEIPSGLDEGPAVVLPPQPHLMPTSKTYVSVVDAYLVAGDEPLAWKAFQEVGEREELTREQALYRKYVRGCYLLTDCTHIEELLRLAVADGIVFTNRMCLELARMHGFRHLDGIEVVLSQIPLESREKKQQYMEELVTSCAYKHNTQGVVDTIQVLPAHGLSRSAKTEMAVFICCLQHPHHKEAREMMHFFQDKALLLDIPVYDSLLREMYFKYTRRGSTFDESSRTVAMRTLQTRKALFDAAFRERQALEDWATSAYHLEYRATSRARREDEENSSNVATPMKYWCQLHALECAPLMFTQHVVEVITTIRDKESKLATQQLIREALSLTPDPFLFNLRAVCALRLLDLTYRGQGKLSKQMLSVLSTSEPQPHHIAYCISQLSVLTVHIVKEIDDVVQLHRYDRQRILDFCMDALETDNVDKTIGYLISREALYTVETARFFTPKFAELYVLHGVITILQFFKPDVDHSTEMKRHFLREVIDVESLSDEDNDSDSSGGMPLTRRAIFEFKLEHDSEFMAIIMLPMPERQFATATTVSKVDESLCLQLPLADSHVVVVDQDESIAFAYEILMQPSVHRIGIDAEWRPDARGYAQSKCSLLQLACDTHVFLFDLMELSIGDLDELFSHLFSSPSVLKLGFALDGDVRRLQWSFPDVTCFNVVENVVDFHHDDVIGETTTPVMANIDTEEEKQKKEEELRAAKKRRRHRGLSAFTEEILGSPLNKTQQKSDWEERPLTPQQIKYAALDAYCLLMLHDRVTQQKQLQVSSGSEPM